MPKSKNRKDHKKRADKRGSAKQLNKERFIKAIKQMQAKKDD